MPGTLVPPIANGFEDEVDRWNLVTRNPPASHAGLMAFVWYMGRDGEETRIT